MGCCNSDLQVARPRPRPLLALNPGRQIVRIQAGGIKRHVKVQTTTPEYKSQATQTIFTNSSSRVQTEARVFKAKQLDFKIEIVNQRKLQDQLATASSLQAERKGSPDKAELEVDQFKLDQFPKEIFGCDLRNQAEDGAACAGLKDEQQISIQSVELEYQYLDVRSNQRIDEVVQTEVFDSLMMNQRQTERLKLILSSKSLTLFGAELIFDSAIHGSSASAFHRRCDNRPNVLVIFRTESGQVSGGYSPLAFQSSQVQMSPLRGFNSIAMDCGKYKQGGDSFLFSVDHGAVMSCRDKAKSIFCNSCRGPVFGDSDLCIYDNCTLNDYSYSNLPRSYSLPPCDVLGQPLLLLPSSLLAGSRDFRVQRYLVYGLA